MITNSANSGTSLFEKPHYSVHEGCGCFSREHSLDHKLEHQGVHQYRCLQRIAGNLDRTLIVSHYSSSLFVEQPAQPDILPPALPEKP
jgi:hypothetical protein